MSHLTITSIWFKEIKIKHYILHVSILKMIFLLTTVNL